MGIKLITLDDIDGRTIKSVTDIEVVQGAMCVVIILEKLEGAKDSNPLEIVVLEGRGCGKCFGGIDEIIAKKSLPQEVKEWLFDNIIACEEE